MCEPTTVALGVSAAAAALGTGLQVAGQRQQEDAQAATIRRQTVAQEGIRGRAMESAMAATDAVAPGRVEADTAAAVADRRQSLAAAISPEGGYLPGQSAGPQIVRDAVDRGRADGAAYLGARADGAARMGGWNDVLFGIGQQIRRGSEGVNAAGSASRGTAGLLPGQMAGAASAGSGYRLAGDLVNIAGQAAGAYGGGNWGSIFGAPRPNAPKNKPAAL